MNTLYFKDANGEYHPVTVDHLEMRPNSVMFLQFKERKYKRFCPTEIEGLLSVVQDLLGDKCEENNIDIVVLTSEIRIEILNKDRDLNNKEILIDISKIEGKDNQDYVKHMLGDALKKFHHEFVRLPIQAEGGNA